MTERERASEDERIAKLAHDLRTPLTLVAGFAELLERRGESLPAAERAEYVTRIADAARDMRAILDAERGGRVGGLAD